MDTVLFSRAYECGVGGLVVRRSTSDHLGRGFESHRGYLHNNLGQVIHINVPLLPSSITWYRSKDSDGWEGDHRSGAK